MTTENGKTNIVFAKLAGASFGIAHYKTASGTIPIGGGYEFGLPTARQGQQLLDNLDPKLMSIVAAAMGGGMGTYSLLSDLNANSRTDDPDEKKSKLRMALRALWEGAQGATAGAVGVGIGNQLQAAMGPR